MITNDESMKFLNHLVYNMVVITFLCLSRLFPTCKQIIAGDPENVTETWMSNAYSFGMVIWEMVTGEIAYSAYSPVQAAVGIAACGLRPDIPDSCPQLLRSLMLKCWNNCPSKRPQFSDIISTLSRFNNNNNANTSK